MTQEEIQKINSLYKDLDAKDAQINALTTEVTLLKETLAAKNDHINTLKDVIDNSKKGPGRPPKDS